MECRYFLVSPSALLMHARELEPKMLAAVQLAVDDAREDKSFCILIKQAGQRY